MKKQITRKEINAFKRAIEAVCRAHGFSIGHEDHHGAFLIREISESDLEWFRDARYEEWAR
jgi:hypothetical protein